MRISGICSPSTPADHHQAEAMNVWLVYVGANELAETDSVYSSKDLADQRVAFLRPRLDHRGQLLIVNVEEHEVDTVATDWAVGFARPDRRPRPGSRWWAAGRGGDVIVTEVEVSGNEVLVEYVSVDERGVSPWSNTRPLSEFVAHFSPRSKPPPRHGIHQE